MGDVTPLPLQGPSSKEKKYDRQLRLWAAAGQAALEDAHILLVNSGTGVVGIETLKNLVLPGIGQYTIVDSDLVTEADLGVNFFLDAESIGQPRAKRCCELLQELNPDVKGHYITQSIESLAENALFLAPYSHIICSAPTKRDILETLTRYGRQHSIPLFHVQSIGFYSQFSLSLPAAFPVVNTHPDPVSTTDLRLLCPWPELEQFSREKTLTLKTMNDHEHGHVPLVLLLLHHLEDWKSSHEGQVPQNYKQKTDFRTLVSKSARTDNPEGGEENYDEAIAAVLKSINLPSLSSSTREVFEARECKELSSQSANFWVIAAAIRQFHEKHKVLPLPGSVPDMKAQSADYIQLQNIYKAKAREDLAEVIASVRSIEQHLGRTVHIPDQEVEAFCKGAATIKLIRGSSMRVNDVKSGIVWGDRARYIWREFQDPESLVSIYLAFLAWELYSNSNNSASGPRSFVDLIISSLQEAASAPTTTEEQHGEVSLSKDRVMRALQELERAQGAELHNISSLTGGLVAQEAIKVITKQYIPIDNTCVFDGISSRTAVMKLF